MTHMSRTKATTRLQAAGAGVLAAGAGLAGASGFSALLNGVPSPVISVSNRVVDWAPVWLIEFGKNNFGLADKPILIGTVAIVVVVLAATAGLVGLKRPTLALGITAILGLAALAAAATDRTATASPFLVILPSMLALAVSLSTLAWLLAALARRREDQGDRWLRPHPGDDLHSNFDRRRFLVAAMATGAVAAAGGVVTRVFGDAAAAGSRTEFASNLTTLIPAEKAPPIPNGTDLGVRGVTPYITRNGDFYRIDTALTVPDVPADTWTLRIHGDVEEELELSFEDLLGMRLVERRITMTCVSNEVGGELIGTATWIGVPMADILDLVGIRGGADGVLATSDDGWTCAIRVNDFYDRQALLAVAMNGEPLPLEHGFPVRVVVPGLYGMVGSTKWVRGMEIGRFADFEAYWTQRGWDAEAPIKTQSRIDTPTGFQELTPADDGSVTLGGVAWAQTTGIAKVEVQIDRGDWLEADLGTEDSVDTWRMWKHTWADPTPGSHTITVRATDKGGDTQTSDSARPLPNGATGWHTITFSVA
jgi:DMSO/TMAO reductase YedYZ molybdopterin-dependent catalytic subunit